MQKQLIYDLTQEMTILRKEINNSTGVINKETQGITREIESILVFLQKRNREVERRLGELNKLIYTLTHN